MTQLNNTEKNSALLVMDFQKIIINNFLQQESARTVIHTQHHSFLLHAQQAYQLSMSVLDSAMAILRLARTTQYSRRLKTMEFLLTIVKKRPFMKVSHLLKMRSLLLNAE